MHIHTHGHDNTLSIPFLTDKEITLAITTDFRAQITCDVLKQTALILVFNPFYYRILLILLNIKTAV